MAVRRFIPTVALVVVSGILLGANIWRIANGEGCLNNHLCGSLTSDNMVVRLFQIHLAIIGFMTVLVLAEQSWTRLPSNMRLYLALVLIPCTSFDLLASWKPSIDYHSVFRVLATAGHIPSYVATGLDIAGLTYGVYILMASLRNRRRTQQAS